MRGRAYIRNFILMNWRGVPFQIIEMDRRLTALEGANGAGKTTMMISPYLALMPDLSKLSAGNVGATDNDNDRKSSGLYGRLGKEGACYAVLEVSTPLGERCLFGVMAVPKASQQVEIRRMFAVRNLPENVALENVLLVRTGQRDSIPVDASVIKEQAILFGAEAEVFRTVSEYGSALYDAGILPIKLGDPKKQAQFNNLLNTGFLGNFSKELQTRIKEYLLPEGRDMGNHLNLMQEHMRLCRNSRISVERLEAKIDTVHSLHQNALKMMDAAAATVRLLGQEQLSRVEERGKELAEASGQLLALQSNLNKTTAALVEAKSHYATSEDAANDAKLKREVAEEALRIAKSIEALEVDREQARGRFEFAQKNRDVSLERLTVCKSKERSVSTKHQEVCGRLANADEHWKQITREAGLYAGAAQSLEEAKEKLPEQNVSTDSAQNLLKESIQQEQHLSEEFRLLRQATENAEQDRAKFKSALDLVIELAGKDVSPEDGFVEAQSMQNDHLEKARIIENAQTLPGLLATAENKARRQSALRTGLSQVEGLGSVITSAEKLRQTHGRFQNELNVARRERTKEIEHLSDTKDQLKDANNAKPALIKAVEKYLKTQQQQQSLEQRYERELSSEDLVKTLIDELVEQKNNTIRQGLAAEQKSESLRHEIERVLASASEDDETLAQTLNGQRLSSMFEDVDSNNAADLQAKLGPLTDAYVVKNIETALQALDQMKEPPEEVWLLERGKFKIENIRGKRFDKFVSVVSELGTRATRIPQFPKLGHLSRKNYIDHLQGLRKEADKEATNAKAHASSFDDQIQKLQHFKSDLSSCGKEDPSEAFKNLELLIKELGRIVKTKAEKIDALAKIEDRIQTIVENLVKWLPEGYLLDEEDYSQTIETIKKQIAEIDILNKGFELRKPKIEQLIKNIGLLRFLPPTEQEVADMQQKLEGVSASLTFWSKARQSLDFLVKNLQYFRFEDSLKQLQTMEDPTEKLRALATNLAAQRKGLGEDLLLAQNDFDASDAQLSVVRGEFNAVDQDISHKTEQLKKLEVPGTDAFAATARMNEREALMALEKIRKERDGLDGSVLHLTQDISQKEAAITNLKNELIRARADWEPTSKCNDQLRGYLQESKTLTSLNVHIDELVTDYGVSFDANSRFLTAWGELRSKVESIEHDLSHPMRQALAEQVPAFITMYFKENRLLSSWNECCGAWEIVLAHISQIVPADIVVTGNPVEAVEGMRSKHKALKEALKDAEQRFKTSAENVATVIRTKIRKESRGITNHNIRLQNISFGNIAGIKVYFKQREDMMRLLDVMSNQEEWNLFQQTLIDQEKQDREPALNEVMNRVYRHITGGRAEGDVLLDYRNYVNMSVLIRRKSSQEWVPAAEGLSTGEAMGIGAAILMVVLQAWEDQTSLRDKSLNKNMRFLFMDEANRLDSQSINTLLEFCKVMDVQLLVAGPSFKADETGRGVTYRLARQIDENSEYVVVRARKGFGGLAESIQ